MATKSHIEKIRIAKSKGYSTTLLFFWIESVELAKERVKIRVKEGGHNIPPEIIKRRYFRGIKNLFDIFIPEIDRLIIFDNSTTYPELIARKNEDNELEILNEGKFGKIKMNYEESR